MSSNATQFTTGPTRDVQPGDTPDLNDGQLSRPQSVSNILRGQACVIDSADGLIKIATDALVAAGNAPFVPIESVDNSAGLAGDTEMAGMTAPQRIAVTWEADTTLGLTLYPGDYVMVDNTITAGNVAKWSAGAASGNPKYARFLGIEAALFDRATTTPFGETLTAGIVPDQSVTLADGQTKVIWVQLVENGLQ